MPVKRYIVQRIDGQHVSDHDTAIEAQDEAERLTKETEDAAGGPDDTPATRYEAVKNVDWPGQE